uniref:Uncharacterized protein n=1 Tax=Tetranychus urticae TaxID=32264 RepID=T1L3A5_TETUR
MCFWLSNSFQPYIDTFRFNLKRRHHLLCLDELNFFRCYHKNKESDILIFNFDSLLY